MCKGLRFDIKLVMAGSQPSHVPHCANFTSSQPSLDRHNPTRNHGV